MYGNVPEYILADVGYLSVVLYCSVPVIRRAIVRLMCVFCYQLLLLGINHHLSLSTSLMSCEIPVHSILIEISISQTSPSVIYVT